MSHRPGDPLPYGELVTIHNPKGGYDFLLKDPEGPMIEIATVHAIGPSKTDEAVGSLSALQAEWLADVLRTSLKTALIVMPAESTLRAMKQTVLEVEGRKIAVDGIVANIGIGKRRRFPILSLSTTNAQVYDRASIAALIERFGKCAGIYVFPKNAIDKMILRGADVRDFYHISVNEAVAIATSPMIEGDSVTFDITEIRYTEDQLLSELDEFIYRPLVTSKVTARGAQRWNDVQSIEAIVLMTQEESDYETHL